MKGIICGWLNIKKSILKLDHLGFLNRVVIRICFIYFQVNNESGRWGCINAAGIICRILGLFGGTFCKN